MTTPFGTEEKDCAESLKTTILKSLLMAGGVSLAVGGIAYGAGYAIALYSEPCNELATYKARNCATASPQAIHGAIAGAAIGVGTGAVRFFVGAISENAGKKMDSIAFALGALLSRCLK